MRQKREKIGVKHLLFSNRNIFKWLFLVIKGLFKKEDILKAKGTHIITGYPGSGKTLLMNRIINSVDSEKYFFLSNIPEFNGVKTFNLTDIFNNTEQVKSFPLRDDKGRRLYAIIFDEINLQFNKRLNRKTDYNDLFIGLIEFLITARHQGVKRVYFIGQKLELQDTQLISLFKYQHDIFKTKRRPKYWFYYENGYVDYIPTKLKVINRIKDQTDQFIDLPKKAKYKINKRHLTTYNTAILGETYAKLENVKIN